MKKFNDYICMEIYFKPFSELNLFTKVWHIFSLLSIVFYVYIIALLICT